MTLIINAFTDDFVIQAVDRRVISVSPMSIVDDDVNKALLYYSNLIFSFAGNAYLPPSKRIAGSNAPREVPSIIWLGQVLFHGNSLATFPERIELLKEEISTAINTLRSGIAPDAHICFIGIGWMQRSGMEPLRPTMVKLSTYEHHDQLQTSFHSKDPDGSIWVSASRPLPAAIEQELISKFDDCMATGFTPEKIGNILLEIIRRVSKGDDVSKGSDRLRGDFSVGRGVLLNCLPRSQTESDLQGNGWNMESGPLDLNRISFLYYSPRKDNAVQYGPAMVNSNFCHSSTWTTGSKVRFIPPSNL